jgi:hypothetical protein
LRGDRLFAASTPEPATPRTIRHQHAAVSTTPAPFWAGSPTAALNCLRAVTNRRSIATDCYRSFWQWQEPVTIRPRVALRPAFRRQHPRARNATDHPPPTRRGQDDTGAILGRVAHRGLELPSRRHQQRPSPPRDGTIWADFPPMLCTATARPPSGTEAAPPLTYLGHHWAVLRTVTIRMTTRRRFPSTRPLKVNAAVVHPMVTVLLYPVTPRRARPRIVTRQRTHSFHLLAARSRDGPISVPSRRTVALPRDHRPCHPTAPWPQHGPRHQHSGRLRHHRPIDHTTAPGRGP